MEFCSAVSEKKSKMSQQKGQGGRPVFPIGTKNIHLVEDVEILLPVKFRWILFSGFREVENVSINQRPRQSAFPNGPKNANYVEDVEILLPVKFGWILFSGLREKVENISANQRPGWPSCSSHRPEKHLLGRGRWYLTFCQVSLNSIQRFQRCLYQSVFRLARKHKLGRGLWDLASCQFSLNSVKRFQRRSRKCFSQSEARADILFFRSTRKIPTW